MHTTLLPEWALQDAILLTWPHAKMGWGRDLTAIEVTFTEIVRAVLKDEAVLIVCETPQHRQHIRTHLRACGIHSHDIHYFIAPTNDIWVRDYGPLSVKTGNQIRLKNCLFNGWGKKYPYQKDNQCTHLLKIQEAWSEVDKLSFVLEGGSLETDGQGTLLTTRRCLLHPSRNPGHTEATIEKFLKDTFGFQRIVWLKHGFLKGDDTDGHIDTLARFANPDTILYTSCEEPRDPHYGELGLMEKELRTLKTPAGHPYHLVGLPIPRPQVHEGQRLPANYVNFLILNRSVLFPTYQDPMDDKVAARLQAVFPHHTIQGIDSRALIQEYGSLHCATMQLPKGALPWLTSQPL